MRLTGRLYRRIVHKYFSRDLMIDLQLHAKRESVDYILEHMRDASMFRNRWRQIAHAVEVMPEEGLILEFGVADGRSVNFMAERTDRTIHGFDSFKGLPERWSGTFELKGKFSRCGKMPKVRPGVELHKGWFDETLPGFLAKNEGPIALLHVDCDLYSSTKTVLDLVEDRIVEGTVVLFDEYFNYPNWQAHEFKAWKEFVQRTGLRYEYIGFAAKNGHVMTRVLGRA